MQYYESAALRNPADTAAAGFYITNAYNSFWGNAASGGWTGFSFVNLPTPVGSYRGHDYANFNPQARPMLLFDGNTAHSAGWGPPFGTCVYVGGRLAHMDDGTLRYSPGREGGMRSQIDKYSQPVPSQLTNIAVHLCNVGVQHWGGDALIRDFEVYDSALGAVTFGASLLHRGHIQEQTGNVRSRRSSGGGFQLYDTWARTFLDDVTFAGIPNDPNFRAIFPMDHSDTWRPQLISAVANISFASTARASQLRFTPRDTGSSWNYAIFDYTCGERPWHARMRLCPARLAALLMVCAVADARVLLLAMCVQWRPRGVGSSSYHRVVDRLVEHRVQLLQG